MDPLPNGLIVVAKRECPTCVLVEPLLRQLANGGPPLTVYSQDDPTFPEDLPGVIDDRELAESFRHGIEIVPTLIRFENGKEVARAIGWNTEEWRQVTGVDTLGIGLPANRPTALKIVLPDTDAARLYAIYVKPD